MIKKISLLVIFSLLVAPVAALAQSPDGPVLMADPSLPVDPAIAREVESILNRDKILLPSLDYYYAITNVQTIITGESFYHTISLAGLTGLQQPDIWNLVDNGAWTGILLLWPDDDGNLSGDLQGSLDFFDAVNAVGVLALPNSEEQMELMDVGGDIGGDSYWFPWEGGKQAFFGPRGVHTAGYGLSGFSAVDFVSGSDLGSDAASDGLYASADGIITYVCRDPYSVAIRAGPFLYAHLMDNSSLNIGAEIEKGQMIGRLRHASFCDGSNPAPDCKCGWATQQDDHWHVHLAYIDPGTIQFEKWILYSSGEYFEDPEGTRVNIGGWLAAEHTNDGYIPPEGMTGGNFWDHIVTAATSAIGKLANQLFPSHTSLGLAAQVGRYAAIPIWAFLIYGVLDYSWAMMVFMAVLAGESVRVIYAIWRIILKAIPMAN